MQSSGKITVNGDSYTLGSTYTFKGNIRGKASSDGSGATAVSLDELAGMAADYKNNFHPKMVLKYYNEGAAYPYCLYYPAGFWGGTIHGWYTSAIFSPSMTNNEGTSGDDNTSAKTVEQTITPPLGGTPKTYKKLKGRYKKNGAYITAAVFYKENDEWIKGGPFIKGSGTWK